MSFNQQFDQHGIWRREFALRLKRLTQWMKDHDLLNAAVEERLQRLELQVRADKVMVAFVAEFSRGKSELINAIFFAGYGRRIMPASAGRTTMCPTELGYDPDIAPCLRLLPIETRLQPRALMEWRLDSEKWLQIDLDVNNPAQLAQALQKVAEVRHVSRDEARATRLVVLNKIDTLWDALSTPEQVQGQIDRQRATSADILGLPVAQVIPVPVQKGLVAKMTGDEALLQASQLPALELALGQGVMGQRQKILQTVVAAGIAELKNEAGLALRIRRCDQAEQMLELRGLRGKNISVIKRMRSRIEQEQADFSAAGAKIQAVRSVHHNLLGDLVSLLSVPALKVEMTELITALRLPGIKLRLKKTYGHTFLRLREALQKAQRFTGEIQFMLDSSFRQLNADFGFSLQLPQAPQMTGYMQDLEQIERSHLQYLGLGNVIRLAQADFSDRLVRALSSRVHLVFESALGEVKLWNKSASSQLDAQLRERRRNFERRLDAIGRIQQAASGLGERIAEINDQDNRLKELEYQLDELTSRLLDLQPLPAASHQAPVAPASLALAETA